MFKMRKLITILLTLTAWSWVAGGVTLNVPGDFTTIQSGINAAGDGDTVLVADGIYSGSGNKNLDFAGRSIVVMSQNGPENCVIDCQYSGRGFYFHSGETHAAAVSGFTIRYAYSAQGGGVHINGASSTIENCIFWKCYSPASFGGGIYASGGDPLVRNCTFRENNATYGGTMYLLFTSAVVTSCISSDNTSGT
jgi:hypothetical protein